MRIVVPVFWLMFGVGIVLASGCGKTSESRVVELAAEPPLSQNQLGQVKAFDDKLANLQSTQEAKEMLGDVLGAMSVSFKDTGPASVQAAGELDAILDKLAAKEISLRKPGVGVLSASSEAAGLISPDKIAETISDLSPSPVSTGEIVDFVKEGQKELRELVPNIAPSGSENMTPVEAMMVSYVMCAAGSGGTSPESIALDISKEKAAAFAKELAE